MGRADVATKRDLADLATKQDLERVRAHIGTEITSQTRTMCFAIVTIVLTMAGLTFGLVVALVP